MLTKYITSRARCNCMHARTQARTHARTHARSQAITYLHARYGLLSSTLNVVENYMFVL